MTAKEYLQKIRHYKYQIAQYYLRLEELYTVLGMGAIDYSKDKVQTSPQNKIEDVIAKIDEIRNERLKAILDMELFIDEATKKINELPNESYREVLTERFINLRRYEAIADKMYLENQSARKLCGIALSKFEEMHKDFLKSVNTNQH